MSRTEIVAFFKKAAEDLPGIQDEVGKAGSKDEAFRIVVEEASAAGFSFTADELELALSAQLDSDTTLDDMDDLASGLMAWGTPLPQQLYEFLKPREE